MRVAIPILIAFAVVVASGHAEESRWPEGVEGFSGQVRGIVVGEGDKLVEFRVARVLRVWKDNEAEKPEALVGETIRIGPRWVKGEGDRGWHPVELHTAFLGRLEKGEEITLEIRTSEAGRFALLELSEEQRKRARGDVMPEGVPGFVGRVRGVVLEKLDENVVLFRIAKVTRVWKGNEATNIEAMEGLVVKVGPRWRKGEDGKWRQDERHVRFVKSLAEREELDLEIRHGERDYFPILELSKEQRERTEPR